MSSKAFDQFSKVVVAAGLKPVDRGNGHWQIVGGPLLVNYYNHKGTIYVAGTTGKKHGGWEHAIKATRLPPSEPCRRDERRGHYRNIKKRMLRSTDRCHWCGLKLVLDTATLDHRIPLARGGLDNANNWVLACAPCNHGRGHDMPELRINVTVNVNDKRSN